MRRKSLRTVIRQGTRCRATASPTIEPGHPSPAGVARLGPDAERNGLALGVIVAVLDLTLLIVSGAPFSALMVLSAIGRIGGGYVGGW